jgi:hypothetical protein
LARKGYVHGKFADEERENGRRAGKREREEKYRSLIAVQAGVDRKDMAVVTATRK